ncbi:imidazolonepropionase [bacterium]|nr:imidazolonepropionase [bacterium]
MPHRTHQKAELVVYNTSQVLTCAGGLPKRGATAGELKPIERGAVAVAEGKILAVGPEDHVLKRITDETVMVNAHGGILLPGLIDSHTHPVYGGDRSGEFLLRLGGAGYEELQAKGLGIQTTVNGTRSMSLEQLLNSARKRLRRMMAEGVTTFEAKSGYGLDLESELKLLRAIKQLNEEGTSKLELVPTFMGAHLVPKEYADRRGEYLDLVCEEMLPQVAQEGLAEFCDVFCDVGAFTVEESRRVLTAAKSLGLGLKLHADELACTGGTELGVELGARSVDHLPYVSEAGIAALGKSDTAAVLLPATTFFLFKDRYAPGRALVDAGAIVALATDHNPGSSHTQSILRAVELGVMRCGLTAAEAIVAVTANAAYAIGREATLGSIETGKQADLTILDVATPEELIYAWGVNHITGIVKHGELVTI